MDNRRGLTRTWFAGGPTRVHKDLQPPDLSDTHCLVSNWSPNWTPQCNAGAGNPRFQGSKVFRNAIRRIPYKISRTQMAYWPHRLREIVRRLSRTAGFASVAV